MTSETPTTRELAARESDGVRVRLLWHPREDAVTAATGLDAFHHPFAHAA